MRGKVRTIWAVIERPYTVGALYERPRFLFCANLVVVMMLCISAYSLAQDLTQPGRVTPIGPQGGMVNSIVVDPQDSSTVYAASSTGVFKSSDGGTTWRYGGLTGWVVTGLAIDPERPATIYAWGPGDLFKSLDAGVSWNQVPGMPLNLSIRAVDPRNQGTLYGTLGPTGLFKSNDGGATWQPAGAIPNTAFGPLAIDPRDPNTVYVVGYPTLGRPSLTLFKSTNGGISFSQLASGISGNGAVGLAID